MAHTSKNPSGYKSFQATAVAIAAWRRVKLDANGLISLAGNNDAIGVTQEAIAISSYGTVQLFSAPGTIMFAAAGAFAKGAVLHPAANGTVDDAVVGNALGYVAIDAATAANDVIEATRVL